MTRATDFRNSLPVWIPLFIIVTGFFHGASNAVWLKLAFHPSVSWFEVMSELVSKPNEFFWIIVGIYIFDLIAVVLGFIMLYGRSVSKSQEKDN